MVFISPTNSNCVTQYILHYGSVPAGIELWMQIGHVGWSGCYLDKEGGRGHWV